MIWQVQLDPAMCAASVHARLPRRLGRRTPLSNPQHRLHPAKQRKAMGLLESLAEATAIMSGELRDTEPTPVHSFIVPCRASAARLLATGLSSCGTSLAASTRRRALTMSSGPARPCVLVLTSGR